MIINVTCNDCNNTDSLIHLLLICRMSFCASHFECICLMLHFSQMDNCVCMRRKKESRTETKRLQKQFDFRCISKWMSARCHNCIVLNIVNTLCVFISFVHWLWLFSLFLWSSSSSSKKKKQAGGRAHTRVYTETYNSTAIFFFLISLLFAASHL